MPQPLVFQDFSGGIADRYVDTDVRRVARLDNLLLDEVNKPYVRDGSFIFDAYLPSSPNQAKPTGLYIDAKPFHHPLAIVGQHAYTLNELSGWTEVYGPAGNEFLAERTDAVAEAAIIWRRQLIAVAPQDNIRPSLIYCPSLSLPQAMTALTIGLPELASSPATVATGSAWSGTYAFFYQYTYTDFLGTEFLFRGNPILLEVTNATGDPSAANIDLTSIPTLANTSYTNYDVTNVTVEIYRTINGGQNYFFLASIANGIATYTDSTADSTISDNALIYTAGGALGWDMPPVAALAVTQTYDTFWYATETSLYQSVSDAPGGCPVDFVDDLDQKIKGLSNIIAYPVLFCDQSIYRVEGTFDSFGNNGFQRREIHPTAGCISNKSIVRTPLGIFWFGNGGIYWTNGYEAKKITHHLDWSYAIWSNSQVAGCFDPTANLVRWTISSTPNNHTQANNRILVLHLNYGVTEEAVFTTESSEGNICPTSLAFSLSKDIYDAGAPYRQFFGKTLYTEGRGYLLWFDPNSLTDPYIDASVAPASMTKKAIIWNFITAGLDQGSPGLRKYTAEVAVEIDCPTQVAVQIRHRRDDGGAWSGTGGSPPSGQGTAGSPGGGTSGNPGVPELRQDGPITWNITDCAWMTDPIEHLWNSSPLLVGRRSVPFGKLRSERRQMSFTNAYTVISASDDVSTGTVAVNAAPTLSTVTLSDITKRWPDDCEGYFLTFVGDSYTQSFEIVSRVSDTVVSLRDPYALLTAGTKRWEMKGYRKFERPRIMSFTLYGELEGTNFTPSTAPQGSNT